MNLDQPLKDLICKVEALDDMFDCPVCFERLSGNVPQCTQGHHLCLKCRTRVSLCPVCKRNFNGTRNYFIESVISKFDEMKLSITSLSAAVGKNNAIVENERKSGLTIASEGKFPCGDSFCDVLLPFGELINHIKAAHAAKFLDVGPAMLNEYDHWWICYHSPNSAVDKIVYIHNMGVFYVKIDISHKGNVYGHVEIANSVSNAKHFYYTLKMGNDKYAELFNGQVVSSGTTHNRTQYLSIKDLLWKVDNENRFYCYLTITYLP